MWLCNRDAVHLRGWFYGGGASADGSSQSDEDVLTLRSLSMHGFLQRVLCGFFQGRRTEVDRSRRFCGAGGERRSCAGCIGCMGSLKGWGV